MRRSLSLAAAAALFSSLLFAGSASADGPIGGCPPSGKWFLVLPMHQPQPEDRNGDGWLCLADFFVGPGILPVDNVVRER